MYYNFMDSMIDASHILIGGCTGSGKSVLLNDMIISLINGGKHFTTLNLYLIDPKRVELWKWSQTEYCLGYATDAEDIINMLDSIIGDIEAEYTRMRADGMRENTAHRTYIVIDEFADLMVTCKKEFLPRIQRILQIGRAAGYHIIAATQSPSRVTIPAALTLNFTHIVALHCRSSIESNQLVGQPGAESLPLYGKAYLRTPTNLYLFDVPLTPESVIDDTVKAHYREPVKEKKARRFTLWDFIKAWA